ncbi:MAG: response regulator [Rhodobacter sp.]|nr:response regulator [Rhodobacter sp.]
MPFPPDAPTLFSGKAAPDALPFRGITLLLVEDSRFTCDAIRLICLRAGGRLKRAETLAAARAHLACYRPDVVIVDLGLPDGRGEALIADLAAMGLPVLGISGDPDGRAPALAAGAAGFLDKPIGSTAAFQRQILALVGGNEATATDAPQEPLPGDPLALRDDLARAAALIEAAELEGLGLEGVKRGYAADFLRSLGRATGDPALEAAAAGAASEAGLAALARLVADRLAQPDPVA